MKFVDQAIIHVQAGRGGDGCLSFRRERFIPKGGPDGGDGGHGGNVYLKADADLNTLVDYRFQPKYKAPSGEQGSGNQRSGKEGEDIYLSVPVGTYITDVDTNQRLGDLDEAGATLLVAEGGKRGLGNTRYKSSVNRSPRQTTKGELGESRTLRLELRLLADVGLLGLPNAGKSTFLQAVSAAKPKIADYPFTTLIPQLGTVQVESYKSFVIADIPGLIAGAAQGAGLGIRFLRHLARTQLLLHIIDIAPWDEETSPSEGILTLENELQQFSPALACVERWLVINKIDQVADDELQDKVQQLLKDLDWQKPVFQISALARKGTEQLCQAVQLHLESDEVKKQAAQLTEAIQQEVQAFADQQVLAKQNSQAMDEDDHDDDDDHEVEIVYSE